MKKSDMVMLFSIVFSIVMIMPGIGQISITSSDLFSFLGTQKTMETDTSGSVMVNVGSAGASRTWDFTNTTVQGNIESWDFLNPTNTPYSADFPTANIALRISSTSYSDTVYSFYRIENSSLTEVGQVLFFQDTTVIQHKSLLVLPLPCSMGSNWVTRDSTEFGIAGNSIVELEIQSNTIDAWGTVNVPSGQYNCLRLREDDDFISKTYVNNILIFSDTVKTVNYTWITKEVLIAAQAESQENDTDPNFTNASTFSRNIQSMTPIAEPAHSAPNKFRLYANYPNPFNASTEIAFDLPKDELINLAIYNVMGQMVAELANGRMSAGTHRLVWNADQMPSGLYYLQLKTENDRQVKKMILMK
jgi:hypothetical protein